MEIIQKLLTSPVTYTDPKTQKKTVKNIFSRGRGGQSIQLFVIHKQAGNGLLYGYFMGGERGASSTYQVMKSGQIYQFVREEDTAFANGNGDWNRRSLSIEFEGAFKDAVTDAQYENCSQLIASLSKKYNFPCEYRDANALKNLSTRGISIHKNIIDTGCPANVDYMRVINRAREILNVTPPNMDTVVYKGQTFGRDDVARIVSNLSGRVGTYDWEFEKFRKDPVTAVFDWIGWKDYKNETAKQMEQKDREWQAKTDLLNKRILDDTAVLNGVKSSNEKMGLEISDLKASITEGVLERDNLLHQVNVLEQNNKEVSEKFTGTIKDREEQISHLTEFKVDVLEGSKGLLIGAVVSAILGLLALLFRGKDQKSEKLQKLFIVLALLAVVAGVCFFIYKVFSGGI